MDRCASRRAAPACGSAAASSAAIRVATHDRRWAAWNPSERAAAARGSRQLLALDTDDEAELRWLDMGTCWFLLRPEDLARGAFERTTCVVQSC